MALLWIGPFYVVVMWTVVSSFLGSTWSARSIYDGYFDNEIGTKTRMEKQEDSSTKDRTPYENIGNYLYERISEKNPEPNLFITDILEDSPGNFPFRSVTSTNNAGESNEELWSKFPTEEDKLTRSEASNEMAMNELLSLNDVPTKKTMGGPPKYQGHSLSIVNPLDVLRQRVMLDLARRKMKESQEQIKANDVILKSMGKRKKRAAVNDDKGAIVIRKRNPNQNTFDLTQNRKRDESDLLTSNQVVALAKQLSSGKALGVKRQNFSVVNALDVLDQQNKLRRKLKENEDRIMANNKFLKSLGKKRSTVSQENKTRSKAEA